MADPCSTTRDLLDFTGNLEDAFKRANDDKASARKILDAKPAACTSKGAVDPQSEAMAKAIRDVAQTFSPLIQQQHQHLSTLRLVFADGGLCSGTAVAPHTLLTATHCVQDSPLTTVNVEPMHSLAQVDDGNDHTLVVTDQEFPIYSPIVQRKPYQGEDVHYWGNPMDVTDMYRRGYIGGYCNVPTVCMDIKEVTLRSGPWRGEAYTIMVQGAPGDSGAGVFDTDGEVIGVVSAFQTIEGGQITQDQGHLIVVGGMTVMEGLPLAFSPETLEHLK